MEKGRGTNYFILLLAFMRCSWLRICLRMRRFSGVTSKQLVLSQELEAALEAQLADGDEAQSVVRAGSTGIGQVLGLADVDIDVLAGSGVADDHALVDLLAGAHQQSAALLRVEQAVGDGLAGLKADQRPVERLAIMPAQTS